MRSYRLQLASNGIFISKRNKVEVASTGTLYDMEFASSGIWQ